MPCLVCESELTEFMNFGRMPISNNFSRVPLGESQYTFDMRVAVCENCCTVQLVEQPEKEKMFHEEYAFFSSTSTVMDAHFRTLSEYLISKFDIVGEIPRTLEIGCNDGILLKYLDAKSIAEGVEPSSNVAEIAKSKGLNVINAFFDEECVKNFRALGKYFDIVVGSNVICHIPSINVVFSNVERVLKNKGIFVHEDPYLLDILSKGTFDQIYDEHVFFFSCLSQQKISAQNGLVLYDVELIPTHGGSARYFFCKPGAYQISDRLKHQINLEYKFGLNRRDIFDTFAQEVRSKKEKFCKLIENLKQSNKKVVGYGATSKSATILNFFGLDNRSIDCIYDTTPTKIGTYTPGADIPIKDYKTFREEDAEFVILFAWNHRDEIFNKEAKFFKETGKKWLTILPKIEVIDLSIEQI